MISDPRLHQFHKRVKRSNYRAHRLGGIGTVSWKLLYDKGIAQGWKCVYCGCDIWQTYTIDHVIPLCKGGLNKIGNIVLACERCNNAKGDTLICKGEMTNDLHRCAYHTGGYVLSAGATRTGAGPGPK